MKYKNAQGGKFVDVMVSVIVLFL